MEKELIKEYTQHCLNCKVKPCQKGCPLVNDIPIFIKYVKEGNIKQAYKVLTQTTMLGGVCGEICPHEKQCQGHCVRGIKGEPVHIGAIEAYVFNEAIKNEYYKEIEITKELKGKRVAVIGSGPAGLNCAAFLARSGAEVTINEKYNLLGGILARGIPDFRLSKQVLENTINQILSFGIKTEYGKILGKNIFLEELEKNYDAIFLGIGANIPSMMRNTRRRVGGSFWWQHFTRNRKTPKLYRKKSSYNWRWKCSNGLC